jgi:DNA invertase Pin-like site-specific DNA recombinase
VRRQVDECGYRARATIDTVAEMNIDYGISASSGERRPGYVGIISDINECRRDDVLTWRPDRNHRKPIELHNFQF